MNKQYDDEEEEQVKHITIPKHRIIFYDYELSKRDNETERSGAEKISAPVVKAETKLSDKILEYSVEAMIGAETDKDICTKLKRRIDEDPEMNVPSVSNAEKNIEENGVWQVIIGRQYAASITFDARFMIYFHFEEEGKYFLVFRS